MTGVVKKDTAAEKDLNKDLDVKIIWELTGFTIHVHSPRLSIDTSISISDVESAIVTDNNNYESS